MKKRIFTITKDGTQTIFIPELNEHYHSTNGALQEAEIVYLNAGLNYCNKQKINILEIGFGTGLNTYLTMLKSDKEIRYTALELYPLSEDEILNLNYFDIIEGGSKELFFKMHDAKWNTFSPITNTFSLRKINDNLETHYFDLKYDVVYFDAFAPEIQPHLWTVDIFKKIYSSMNDGGILTTYCVKGIVKRALKTCGFKIEKLPGAAGKREMLRATK